MLSQLTIGYDDGREEVKIVPSNNTANIQEAHHLIGHLVCSVFG